MEQASVTGKPAAIRLAAIVGLLGLLALGLVVIFSSPALAAQPQAQPALAADTPVSQVYLVPSWAAARPGEVFTMTVSVDAIAYIYGAQYRILFDPAILEVVDANPSLPGVQIGSSEMFPKGLFFEAGNQADNATGVIEYAATILEPGEPVAGTGVIGRVTFRAKAMGHSAIDFEGMARWPLALIDPSGYAVAADWADGEVVVGNHRLYLPLTRGD